MSSTVSCSSAAQSVSVSSRIPAQIWATPTGWVMNSSPEWRSWSAWRSQAKSKARSTAARSIVATATAVPPAPLPSRARRGVELLDHGEEVGEELAVLYGCLGLSRNRWPPGSGRCRRGTRLSAPVRSPLRIRPRPRRRRRRALPAPGRARQDPEAAGRGLGAARVRRRRRAAPRAAPRRSPRRPRAGRGRRRDSAARAGAAARPAPRARSRARPRPRRGAG